MFGLTIQYPKSNAVMFSFSDHVVKRYSLNIGAGQGKIGARSIRERVFKINTRKIVETQKNNWIVGL